MGSRYLFIVLYVLLEHHLSRGDYRRRDIPAPDGRDKAHEHALLDRLVKADRVQ